MTGAVETGPALVDTNVVVYAYDPGDAVKHEAARVLVERLSTEGRLVFSAQVLNEFCAVMMRSRGGVGLSPTEVSVILHELEATGDVVPLTSAMTFRALDAMPRHGLSFWDALIWAAAAENGVGILYTEDFQHGREIEGVVFTNPFVAGPPDSA
jgi:predicted nucleic acid-binding protein